jgi:hypothetical protein
MLGSPPLGFSLTISSGNVDMKDPMEPDACSGSRVVRPKDEAHEGQQALSWFWHRPWMQAIQFVLSPVFGMVPIPCESTKLHVLNHVFTFALLFVTAWLMFVAIGIHSGSQLPQDCSCKYSIPD